MRLVRIVTQSHSMDDRGNEEYDVILDDIGIHVMGATAKSMTTVKLAHPGAATGNHYFEHQIIFAHCLHGTIRLCVVDVEEPKHSMDQLLSAGEGAIIPATVAYVIISATPEEHGPAMVQIFSTAFPSREYAKPYEVPLPEGN